MMRANDNKHVTVVWPALLASTVVVLVFAWEAVVMRPLDVDGPYVDDPLAQPYLRMAVLFTYAVLGLAMLVVAFRGRDVLTKVVIATLLTLLIVASVSCAVGIVQQWRLPNADKHPLAGLGSWWADLGVYPAGGRLGALVWVTLLVVLIGANRRRRVHY